tara:strand:+ start:217 stop:381 length:165 start_codon:yes stop_codon:yes gene_type:complete
MMDIDDVLCDLYDIKRQAKFYKFGSLLKDNEGTETTINDCIDNVIEQLEELNND